MAILAKIASSRVIRACVCMDIAYKKPKQFKGDRLQIIVASEHNLNFVTVHQ